MQDIRFFFYVFIDVILDWPHVLAMSFLPDAGLVHKRSDQ